MKQYRDGPIPIQKRSCTDSICLFIFFLFTFVMFGIAAYSWVYGNFKQFTYAYDPDGKGCGLDYPNYPYIYFASPHTDSLWVTVCVSACPANGDKTLKCQTNSVVKSCNPTNSTDNTKRVEIYDSSLTASTLCLPTSSILQNNINEALGSQATQIVTLFQNYTLILISLPIAIILAIVLMVIIRFLAGFFIYILIFVTVGALIAMGVFVMTNSTDSALIGNFSFIQDPKLKIVFSLLCFLLAIFIFVLVFCFRSRISLATKVIQVSSVFVAGNCGVVLVPFIMFIVTILFVTLWIVEAFGYYSLGTPKHTPKQYPYQHFEVSNSIMALGLTHVFYLFWVIFFLIETSSFLIIGTAASWYYKRQSPYGQTSQRYRYKHMGSVCVGAFFKALIGFIKFVYDLLTPDNVENEIGCMGKYKKCCDCVCYLCLKLFDWINVGAYTVVNIVGGSYCDSALKAASIRLNNLVSSAVLTALQTIFTIIVRLGITALTVLAVYIIATNVDTYKNSIEDPTLILVIVGLLAFAVSCFFISVYSDAMESIYTTFLLDAQAGGEKGKCPDELADFLEKAQKQAHIVSE